MKSKSKKQTKNKKQQNSVELEDSLATAEAEVGAVAKADQHQDVFVNTL